MNIQILFLTYSLVALAPCFALSHVAREKGFVYLDEVDPTIQSSLRYKSTENFVGIAIDGYKKPVIIMTKQAAQALKSVQKEVQKDGYSLVIYDAYRPQRAVDHFVRWSEDTTNQAKKRSYYPRINKADVFELGYLRSRSGHSRGSTVDLTLIKRGQKISPIKARYCVLLDGFVIQFLDDGTIDMGSSFDLFDTASHYENNLIHDTCKARRTYLKNVMEKHGFQNSPREWWHFTLTDEPYPATRSESYFDFEVE